MRIFLDANSLFSSAKSDGAMRRFLLQLKSGGHILVADGYVVGEARRNIDAKYPAASTDLETVLENVDTPGGAHLPDEFTSEVPEKDKPVLAAAIHLGCDVLLTGDKTHFGSLYGRTLHGVQIHSPASLASRL